MVEGFNRNSMILFTFKFYYVHALVNSLYEKIIQQILLFFETPSLLFSFFILVFIFSFLPEGKRRKSWKLLLLFIATELMRLLII